VATDFSIDFPLQGLRDRLSKLFLRSGETSMLAVNDTAMPRHATCAADLVFLSHGPEDRVGI
jgi:hypothetical protein